MNSILAIAFLMVSCLLSGMLCTYLDINKIAKHASIFWLIGWLTAMLTTIGFFWILNS